MPRYQGKNSADLTEFLDSLPRSTHTLDFRGNHIRDPDAEVLAKATHLFSLRFNLQLQPGDNGIGDTGAEALAKATHLSNLRSLDLSENNIGEAGAKALAQAKHLSKLHSLYLNVNHIGEVGVRALAQATHLSNLQSLDLSSNCIGDAGAKALAAAIHLPNLQSLDLILNYIGDAGAEALAAAIHLPNLQSLNLNSNCITDVGTRALAQATHLANLQSLDLSENFIGDPGARAVLNHLLGLKRIDFSFCKLTAPQDIHADLNLLRQHYQIAAIEPQIPNTKIRVMLIGEPEAGKTTVFKRLLGRPITTLGQEIRTHGLNKGIREFKDIKNEGYPSLLNLQLDLWDLGGQRLQHMCHALFFSTQALYLLILNPKSTETGVDHWLGLLADQKRPDNGFPIEVIPVCNPNPTLGEMVEPKDTQWWATYRDQLSLDNPASVDVSSEDDGMQRLLNRLNEQLEKYPLRYYWKAIDEIAGEVRQLETPYYSYVEFHRKLIELPSFHTAHKRIQAALNTTSHIEALDTDEFAELVQAHLDQQGVIAALRETRIVIVKSSWVEKGLYSLLPPEDLPENLSAECLTFQKRIREPHPDCKLPGIFTMSEVKPYWNALGIPTAEHADLLLVLRMRELGLVMSMGTHDQQEIFCVPAYLDELLRTDEDLSQAIINAYRKARYCSVFKVPHWPPYFIYRHMVWIASSEDKTPDVSRAYGRDHRPENQSLCLDHNTLSRRHYRVMDRLEKAAQIEIIFLEDKLWCFAYFDGDQNVSTYNLRNLIERLWSSYCDVYSSVGQNKGRLSHAIPCPGCMSKVLADHWSHRSVQFSEVELIDITKIERSPDDTAIECTRHHFTNTKDIIEQLSRAPQIEAISPPSIEEVRDAAINVSLFLHDVGLATITGELDGSAIAPLCGDGVTSRRVSISAKTWRAWLRRTWEKDPNYRRPRKATINRFVEHLIKRFPIVKIWADEREPKAGDEAGRARLIVKAAKWLKADPKAAVQRWRDKNNGVNPLTNNQLSRDGDYKHASTEWLATYLNDRDTQK